MKKNVHKCDIDMSTSEYLTAGQAANYLGVHINTIYNYVKKGILTGYRMEDEVTATIFIKKDEIIKKLTPIKPEEYRVKPEKKVLHG